MKVGNVICFREFSRASPPPVAGPAPTPSSSVPAKGGKGGKGAKGKGAPAEEEKPDFSGKWQLTDSRNFDEYLLAMGVNYLKRKVASGMKPVQEWTKQPDGTWQFAVSTPIGLKVEKFPVGVDVADEVDGEKMVKTTTWDGAVMHTAVVHAEPKKAAALGEMSMCEPLARARARAAGQRWRGALLERCPSHTRTPLANPARPRAFPPSIRLLLVCCASAGGGTSWAWVRTRVSSSR
jgi:hypothetical protein